MEKINFVFIGRLQQEKWFDLIIELIKKLKENNLLEKVNFFIFGSWKLELDLFYNFPELIEYVSNEPKSNSPIKFFSWVEKKTINKFLQRSHYCLMPSRFLETFWLAALEAVNYHIPVIWFKKWWLKQFIIDELNISPNSNENEVDKLYNIVYWIINNFDESKYQNQKETSKKLSENYTFDKRFQKFTEITNNKKNILMISDYTSNIWWIEWYIYNVCFLLENKWFETDFIGSQISNRIIRKFCLPFTWFNFVYYFAIKWYIRNHKPEIVWFHSVSRFLGWMGLASVNNFEWKKIFMYHDLWYFHPFPSYITDEKQILSFSLKNFIKMGNTKNPFKIISIILKFFSIKSIRYYIIKNIDIHLVPSEFMVPILTKWWIPKKKITVLPHYK